MDQHWIAHVSKGVSVCIFIARTSSCVKKEKWHSETCGRKIYT